MAPSKAATPPFSKDERVLCFHHEMLYEAKILDVKSAEADETGTNAANASKLEGPQWSYKIHYKGWKASWDDWVSQDRVRKFTDENKELATQLQQQFKLLQSGKSGAKQAGKKVTGKSAANGSDMGSARGSEERAAGAAAATTGRGPRRTRDYDLEHEDSFHARPSIKIPMPDHLKAMLVDDWENITKNNQLVPIPHDHPVDQILSDYLQYERPRRQQNTAAVDVLEETIEGLKEYFNKALGRILLYRFERPQYVDMYKAWKVEGSKYHNACDTYGAEHLCRLLVSLPELLAQTNMDQQSVNRLREELSTLTAWLAANYAKYFVPAYDTPSQEYKDQAS